MAAKGRKLLKVRRAAQFKHRPVRIRRNDTVVVIAGNDRGKQGKVLRVDPARQRVVVEGVNMRWKHVRKTRDNPQGGRIQTEAPIAISNVMVLCGKCNVGRRTRVEFDPEGRKKRVCVKCGTEIPIEPRG